MTLTLTGSTDASTTSDALGNYTFTSLSSGGSYVVTPTKSALLPSSAGINTVDVIATQRHYLAIGNPLSGCGLAAADVNGDTAVNTLDVIAIQRFYLGATTGTGNVGKYQFSPANRSYPGLVTDQTDQNYDTLVFGDVSSPFADRLDGPSQTVAENSSSADEIPGTVATLSLPNVMVEAFVTNFVIPVTTTVISADDNLVGFQGDLTFDEGAVTFQDQPVQKAGLTGGNWNVSGNVLPGLGRTKTLRISAYSTDFTPLSGAGTLFELRLTRVGKAAQSTQLLWAAPPDNFIFIDANLEMQRPGNALPGSVTPSLGRR